VRIAMLNNIQNAIHQATIFIVGRMAGKDMEGLLRQFFNEQGGTAEAPGAGTVH
jgi:hypothetical protein